MNSYIRTVLQALARTESTLRSLRERVLEEEQVPGQLADDATRDMALCAEALAAAQEAVRG